MSKETKPKRTRSTKKVTEEGHTAELEAKIAELEAKLANLSTQVAPETRPAQTSASKPAPKPEPAKPRPTASGPSHGTLPAGMKPAPKPEPKPEPSYTASEPTPGEVAPAYAQISSSGYTGNKYYATRARLAYHPPSKQYKGSTVSQSSTAPPPTQYEPEPASSTQRGTLPAGTKPQEKKSMWKAKGAEYENYEPQEQQKPAPRPAEPEQPKPRPTASGPSHGTLPAGMKPAPKPEPKPEPSYTASEPTPGEVAPAYAQISSSGYTGNRYYATRKRMSYHPANKQFTGSSTTSETAPTPEPPKPKSTFRTTLPAGFKA